MKLSLAIMMPAPRPIRSESWSWRYGHQNPPSSMHLFLEECSFEVRYIFSILSHRRRHWSGRNHVDHSIPITAGWIVICWAADNWYLRKGGTILWHATIIIQILIRRSSSATYSVKDWLNACAGTQVRKLTF